jgi:hypothetical protein
MTLIEVLLAVLMLALMMGVVMSAVSSIAGMESRGHMRLAAQEVANRLLLQYLDDERSLPRQDEAIEYGRYRFKWRLDQTLATMSINRRQESAGAGLQKLDRYRLLCVTVYEAEQDGNFEIRGEPLASLTRIIDPFNARNPDSMVALGEDRDRLGEWIGGLLSGDPRLSADAPRLQGRQLR